MAEEIPEFCKAGVVTKYGPDFEVKVEMVPVPEPGPEELLIRLNATGICFTDLHYAMGDMAFPKMEEFGVRSPGHEGAGVVVKLGSNVTGWTIGERAGIKPVWNTCGSCELCFGNKETYCPFAQWTELMAPGTYQQYIVSPARYTTRIPEGVSDYVAGPVMCSASTVYRSLVEAELRAGDWACFPGGGGGVGIQGVQLAKAMGYRPVVVDSGDDKRKLSMDMGAEAFVDYKQAEDVAKEVVRVCDGVGAHAVFVTAVQAYRTSISLVGTRVGAKVMCIGLPAANSVTISTDPFFVVLKNFELKGTLVGSMEDTSRALDFARRGLLHPIYELFPIDRLPEAVEKLRHGHVAGRCVVDFNA
ncbi:alcohol dehydrogenase [Rhizodiscina lignyota]|uniref:Alcohol dehydrogenase n=1 Tax=Rhizodiscina lignyota TaxID=1504668 RepID=A0A9P4I2V3_9PEZI|nr:alcohol dehydrogenase [Rhizodiscina lignyota]